MKHVLLGVMICCLSTAGLLFSSDSQLNSEQQKAAERLEKMLAQSPRHGGLMVSLAKIYAQAGMAKEAVEWLEKADASGIDQDFTHLTDFEPIGQNDAFRNVQARFTARGPIIASTLRLSLTEPSLKPEGIAYDPVSRRLFLGSIHQSKIVAVDEAGLQMDFVTSGRGGLLGVVGLRVDAGRRHLWVCSNDASPEAKRNSGIFQFDLADGRLLGTYLLPPDSGKHLLNDLVVTKTGEVFTTDSRQGVVYHTTDDCLEPVTELGALLYLNGLCLDEQETLLFISDFRYGLSRLDLQSRRLQPLLNDPGICTLGIDGLYLYQGRLLGIQNACGQERIVAFTLDEGRSRVVKMEVLERGHPRYQVPMTGAIVGDRFCFVAYGKGHAGREMPPPLGDQPSSETVIMELSLKPGPKSLSK
jgi:sugar lactone lactonase YvrE